MGEDRILEVFEDARKQGRKVLIPYITAGFPDKNSFWDVLIRLSLNKAGIIEIGVPFSDPIADGPVIEEVSYRCLKNGVSLKWLLDGLRQYREEIKSEILLMGYCNPFFRFGWKRLCQEAAELKISGFIVPDLPLEESMFFDKIAKKMGLALIRLIGLNTSEDRMKEYAKKAEGFVYFVSVLGTTGARDKFSEELLYRLKIARDIFHQPIAVGFGAKHPSQFVHIKDLIDGIVFGSSLIAHIDRGKSVEEFMEQWRDF